MEAIGSRTPLQAFRIAAVNLRHNMLFSILLSFLLVLLLPVLFGIRGLDSKTAAIPLEMFLSLAGILLLTSVFQPEQDKDIEELVSAKYVNSVTVQTIRVVCALLVLIPVIAVPAAAMASSGCEITVPLVLGTYADALFLGALGMFTAALTDNTAIAYMPPFMFYACSYGGGSKLGNFYLFSMTQGNYEPKPYLFATALLMIAAALLVRILKRRIR